MVRLSDVASAFNGKTPSRADQRTSGHPVLKIRDVDAQLRFRGEFGSFVDPAFARAHSTRLIENLDTLVLNAAHSVDVVASKIYRAEPGTVGALATGEWAVIRSTDPDRLLPEYLNHFLRSPKGRSDLKLAVNGSHLYPGDVGAIDIPLPPLPEQRRIASILDETDRQREQLGRADEFLDELAEATFEKMFGDPLRTALDPRAQPLRQVAKQIIDCPHTTPDWTDSGFLCLRTPNLTRGDWDFSETRYVSGETHRMRTSRSQLSPGDIILSREGTIGIGAVVPEGMAASMGQRLVQVRPDFVTTNSEFLLAYLLEVLAPARLTALLVGSTVQHLNVGDLRELKILVPPRAEQDLFAERMGEIRAARARHLMLSVKLDELFASLQYRAFRGEL